MFISTKNMTSITVNVQQGELRGKTSTDYAGRIFYSFQGIPYAKPPVGELRFKDPQPPESWEGIRDATKEGTISYQRSFYTGEVQGGEDCLFLNIYTPQINNDELRPVMFYIHGGGFLFGSGNTEEYGPEYLLAKNVVLVTTNYRLGVLGKIGMDGNCNTVIIGFLKLEDPSLEVPGNAGLKDIVLALRWVKDNIQQFFGDKNNVTIFGESAGSAAVHYLIFSPLAKGLFHKAIMQSGCIYNEWAKGYYKKEKYIQVLNLKTSDEKDILSTLQKLPVEKVFEIQEILTGDPFQNLRRPYGPEPERPSSNAFLPFDPRKAKYINDVPLLIGYTNLEGIFSVLFLKAANTEPIHKNFENLVPYDFNLEIGSDECNVVAQKIKEHYYKNTEPSLNTLEPFIKLETDMHFIHGIQKSIQQLAKKSQKPIFMYRFSYDGKVYFLKRDFDFLPIEGASHTDDLGYLFTQSRNTGLKPEEHIDAMIKKVTTIWTNFAKYGNPNLNTDNEQESIVWNAVTRDVLNYVDINEELSSGVNPEADRVAFWDRLYEDYPKAKYWC